MVTEFNEACFKNKRGDLVTAETQFGTHIIRIEEQSRPVRKIQMATIIRNIYASDERVGATVRRAHEEAVVWVAENRPESA